MIFGMAGVAGAIPCTWTDTVDPESDIFLNGRNSSYSFQHDITNDGFVPFSDSVSDYSLELWLYDDADRRREHAYINLPGRVSDRYYDFTYESNTFGASFRGLARLNNNGTLNVSIGQVRGGDFYFGESLLTAIGETTVPVPESATILLVGIGLIGLVAIGRKRFNKKTGSYRLTG